LQYRNVENHIAVTDFALKRSSVNDESMSPTNEMSGSMEHECIGCGIVANAEDMEEIEGAWWCNECKKTI